MKAMDEAFRLARAQNGTLRDALQKRDMTLRDEAVEAMAAKLPRYSSSHDGFGEPDLQSATAALDALLALLAERGFAVAPVVATEKMHDKARDWSDDKYGRPIGLDASKGCYTAMLAARPRVLEASHDQ